MRASLSAKPGPSCVSSHGPVSSMDQIKLLADRFVKEGAEDLWNDSDGPVRSSESRLRNVASAQGGPVSSPLDLRKLFGNGGKAGSYVKARDYSSMSNGKERSFWRNGSSSSDVDSGARKWLGEVGSSAALGKCDVKFTNRRPLRKIEDVALSQEVELIRQQHEQRKMGGCRGQERKRDEDEDGESILSGKRFDECGISP